MDLQFNEELFKELWPYIVDDNVTDIKWNGRDLRIEDLTKGRYKADLVLSEEFLEILTGQIAIHANANFNDSEPSLQAETDTLRIHAVHKSVTGNKAYILAIRKTPAVARLNEESVRKQGYASDFIQRLLKALVRGHCSGIIIGDVGAGKTELEKYLASFLPENESVMTVEDTLEMKLPILYPTKDISSVKISDGYPAEQAIRDALRLLVKYLLIAEARGREIARIIEGASTGCTAITTIHAANVWEIPDRVVQMGGSEVDSESFENDVYTFFDFGIKVAKKVTNTGVHRRIDQLCFFDRTDKKNTITVFMKNGMMTGKPIPKSIVEKFDKKEDKALINMLETLEMANKQEEEMYGREDIDEILKELAEQKKLENASQEDKPQADTDNDSDSNTDHSSNENEVKECE